MGRRRTEYNGKLPRYFGFIRPRVSMTHMPSQISSEQFAAELLDKEQTVVTDGAAFGAEGFIRISYATSMDRLQEGVTRIRRVAESFV